MPFEDLQKQAAFGTPRMNMLLEGIGINTTLEKFDAEDRKATATRNPSPKPAVQQAGWEDLFTSEQLAHDHSISSSLEAHRELLAGISMGEFDAELKAMGFGQPGVSKCLHSKAVNLAMLTLRTFRGSD